MDILNSAPLHTIPAWTDAFSYQVLAATSVRPDQLLSRYGRKAMLPENELNRIKSFFVERGNMQLRDSLSRYPTEESPIPVELTPGITEDVDPSATLENDVEVLNTLVDEMLRYKQSGGRLLDEVMETLEDKIGVGPGGPPIRRNTGAPEASVHHDSRTRGNSSATNRRRFHGGPPGRGRHTGGDR